MKKKYLLLATLLLLCTACARQEPVFVLIGTLHDYTMMEIRETEAVIGTALSSDALPLETMEETLPAFDVTPLDQTMWAKASVNVRTYPGIEGDKMGAIGYAQAIHVIGKASTGWWQVEYNGSVGYISGSYLLDSEPQPIYSVDNSRANEQLEHIMTVQDGVPQQTIRNAYLYWGLVPEAIRTKMVKDGWEIRVLNQHYLDEYVPPYKYVVGYTQYGDHLIVMGNSDTHMRRALTHEIGHAIDYMNGWPSYKSTWKQIFEEERGLLQIQEKFDDHPISNQTEFFAECVHQYLQYNDLLKRTCPKAYEFVGRYLN